MAYPVYSRVLYREQGLAAAARTILVPDGQVFVVRDIDAYGDVNVGTIQLYFKEAETSATFAWFNWSSAEQAAKQWRGRQVIGPGDGVTGLIVANNGDSPVDVSVSGYILDASTP